MSSRTTPHYMPDRLYCYSSVSHTVSYRPYLLQSDIHMETGNISEKIERGRHTTRHVELFRLEEDTYVADTPGFSSFDTDQMEVILKENLQYAFPDFADHLGKCQFRDCSHRAEPGCAVTDAVLRGQIEKTRYESYLRLYEKASQVKPWEIRG